MPRLLARATTEEGDAVIATVEIIGESGHVLASKPVTRYKDTRMYFAFIDVPAGTTGPLLAVFLGAGGMPLANVAAQSPAPLSDHQTRGSCWEVPSGFDGMPTPDPTPDQTESA